MSFPKDFTWGAAASSYQIEGAIDVDGRGLSVWDIFCQQPGSIKGGDNGTFGPDHYHRWQEDVNLMAEIGLKAYRLSIAWPRILPEGKGMTNPKGLAFYDRLIDALLEKKIEPWVTLFHWDYPYALFQKGGWLHQDSPDWFADYVRLVVKKISDRVNHWVTLNEPQCFVHFGHQTGIHAPGLKLEPQEILTLSHNVLLAHGKAVQIIRSEARKSPLVGAALVGIIYIPAENTPLEVEAARQATFTVSEKNLWNNTWWADAMIKGIYPEDGLKLFGDYMPKIYASDIEIISQPLDFYGVNIYTAEKIKATPKNWEILTPEPGVARTAMDWVVVPESLYWGPKFIYERYKLPIVITENGMANNDWIALDGKVPDLQRINFLTRYLKELRRSINDGIPTAGYFYWSIMDNFEWTEGFRKRFGLIYVNYITGRRILKDSAFWYNQVIASNGSILNWE